MDLALSSPKLIDDLLPMKHWHNDENSLIKIFSIHYRPHVARKYRCHLHTDGSLRVIVIGKIIYI